MLENYCQMRNQPIVKIDKRAPCSSPSSFFFSIEKLSAQPHVKISNDLEQQLQSIVAVLSFQPKSSLCPAASQLLLLFYLKLCDCDMEGLDAIMFTKGSGTARKRLISSWPSLVVVNEVVDHLRSNTIPFLVLRRPLFSWTMLFVFPNCEVGPSLGLLYTEHSFVDC